MVEKQAPRILILAEGLLGDSLVLTPITRSIKNKFKNSFLSVLLFNRYRSSGKNDPVDAIIKESSFKGAAEVFLNNPYADEVLEIDRNALFSLNFFQRFRAELKNINIIREKKYDIIICTFPKDRFALYAFFSGAKIRLGQRHQPFGILLNYKSDVTENDYNVLQYFSKLLEPLSVNINNNETFFYVSKEAEQNAEEFLKSNNLEYSKNIVGIHPGASMPDRRWPAEHFAKLINKLKVNNTADIILFYNDSDSAFIEEIKRNLTVKIVEANTGSLSELGALFKKCSLCVTNNSGPRHLAAAVGTRTLGLLFKSDDKKWGIYDTEIHPIMKSQKPCSVCPADKCLGIIPGNEKYSAICMRDIEPEDVFNKVIKILEHQFTYQENDT